MPGFLLIVQWAILTAGIVGVALVAGALARRSGLLPNPDPVSVRHLPAEELLDPQTRGKLQMRRGLALIAAAILLRMVANWLLK